MNTNQRYRAFLPPLSGAAVKKVRTKVWPTPLKFMVCGIIASHEYYLGPQTCDWNVAQYGDSHWAESHQQAISLVEELGALTFEQLFNNDPTIREGRVNAHLLGKPVFDKIVLTEAEPDPDYINTGRSRTTSLDPKEKDEYFEKVIEAFFVDNPTIAPASFSAYRGTLRRFQPTITKFYSPKSGALPENNEERSDRAENTIAAGQELGVIA